VEARETYQQKSERMPGMVLHRRVPDAEHVRRQPGFEAVRAECAQCHRRSGEECTESEERLQAGFLVVFFARWGRFLP
jgi:hypothetical protein